ncbi:hypothetical protein CBA19CS91_35955 [Paraburkholderia hospita]|nr:hypothetical protein CBA19CS91_35955 [Paraburkholderia hospita]
MYGMLFVDLAMLALVVWTIRLGTGFRWSVLWRGAYPVIAFATIGAAVEWVGVPFAVYASMYIAGLISAFIGPLVAMIFDHRGGRGARNASSVLRGQTPT